MAQQNLDFNIAANVKGMEAIATLINRVGALETETKRLASANATLASSTDVVIRNGTRYNNALDAQSKELRNARQGTQQLGMQINDFATSVSTGASITQAFNQQIGQVGYAMSMMGGTAGRVGNFLAGPWGAAITIGAMALTPLIEKLFQSESAAKKAADAHYKFLDAVAAGQRAELMKGESDLNSLQQRRLKIQDDLRNKVFLPLPEVLQGSVVDAQGRLKAELDSVNQQIEFLQRNINEGNKKLYKMDTQGAGGAAGAASSGGGSSASRNREIAENLSNVDIIKKNQLAIDAVMREGDANWQNYIDNMSGVSKEAMGQILDVSEALIVTSETLFQQSGKKIIESYNNIKSSFDSIGMSVNNAFKGMLTGAMSWKDGMRGIINAVIDELWRLYVVQQIVGMVSNFLGGVFGFGGAAAGSGGAAAFSNVTSAAMAPGKLGPAFANGTVNAPGGMAWVGERGPELVNLPRGSQVIPAHRAQSMGGGGTIINVDARGASDPAAVRAQVQQGIIEAGVLHDGF